MDNLVDTMVKEKTIRQAQFQDLVSKYACLDEVPLQPLDVRNAKLVTFQEQMMKLNKPPVQESISTIAVAGVGRQ